MSMYFARSDGDKKFDDEMREVMKESCKDSSCGKSLMTLYVRQQEILNLLRHVEKSATSLEDMEVFTTLLKKNAEMYDMMCRNTQMLNDLRVRIQRLEKAVYRQKTNLWDLLLRR